MITVSQINQDISDKLKEFENPFNNTFQLIYNEPFDDKVSSYLMLWDVISDNTFNIVGNNITIINNYK